MGDNIDDKGDMNGLVMSVLCSNAPGSITAERLDKDVFKVMANLADNDAKGDLDGVAVDGRVDATNDNGTGT